MNYSRAQAIHALSGSCLFLTVVIIALSVLPVPEVTIPEVRTRADTTGVFASKVFSPPSEENFHSIDERPLFNPSRVPFAADKKTSDGNGIPDLKSITLVGIIISGNTKSAILKTKNTPFASSVHIGETFQNATVKDISANKVTLSANGLEFDVSLHDKKTTATTALGFKQIDSSPRQQHSTIRQKRRQPGPPNTAGHKPPIQNMKMRDTP